MAEPRLVLASGSPRRRHLLAQLGTTLHVAPADVDETPAPGEEPQAYVTRLARAKAAAVAGRESADTVVVAADTTVVVDGDLLGKPGDPAAAAAMLRRLSGRHHEVHTGVAVQRGQRHVEGLATTLVHFGDLTEADIAWYVATGEPFDKAGAYALQGAGGAFVVGVDGSVSNVVGLPLHLTVQLCRQVGFDLLRSPR